MRTAELQYGLATKPAGISHPSDCGLSLILERLWFHTAWLVCECVVLCELRQTAEVAKVHGKGVDVLVRRERVGHQWKEIGSRNHPEIERPTQFGFATPSALGHGNISACESKRLILQTFSSSCLPPITMTAGCSPERSTQTSSMTTSAHQGGRLPSFRTRSRALAEE